MDVHRFDAFTRVLGNVPSRRALLPMMASLVVPPLFTAAPAAARKKKKKKVTLCLNGQTIQASKKKKKKHLENGATVGACPSPPPPPPPDCIPSCAGKPCGVDDGCGGTCGCAAGSLCNNGACQACTVTCGSNSTTCGTDLQFALGAGGVVYACPGRYSGQFTLAANVSLIGAGQGGDPAVDTILDGIGSGRVLTVNPGVSASLRGLRITGGNGSPGGIWNQGRLTAAACTITKNFSGGGGGGIYNSAAAPGLTLTNCAVSENESLGPGGGINNAFGAVATVSDSAITGNTGLIGGGIFNNSGTFSLTNSTVSGNSAPQCVEVTGC